MTGPAMRIGAIKAAVAAVAILYAAAALAILATASPTGVGARADRATGPGFLEQSPLGR